MLKETVISIPFGTIKSINKATLALEGLKISIPFGTIKRHNKVRRKLIQVDFNSFRYD